MSDELPLLHPRQSECTEYAQSQKTATPNGPSLILDAYFQQDEPAETALRANLSSPRMDPITRHLSILRTVRFLTDAPKARNSPLATTNMRPRHTFRQKGICHPNRKDCSRKFDVLALFKKLMGLKQRFRQPSKKTGHANIHKARWRSIFA